MFFVFFSSDSRQRPQEDTGQTYPTNAARGAQKPTSLMKWAPWRRCSERDPWRACTTVAGSGNKRASCRCAANEGRPRLRCWAAELGGRERMLGTRDGSTWTQRSDQVASEERHLEELGDDPAEAADSKSTDRGTDRLGVGAPRRGHPSRAARARQRTIPQKRAGTGERNMRPSRGRRSQVAM